MLRPKTMKRIRVIALKSVTEDLVRDLHEAGLVHITKTRFEGLESGRPLESFENLSSLLVKLRGTRALMEQGTTRKPRSSKMIPAREAIDEAEKLTSDREIRDLVKQRNEVSETLRELEYNARILERAKEFRGVDFSRLTTQTLDYRMGEAPNAELLKKNLEEGRPEVTVISKPSSSLVLVLFEKAKQAEVDSILTESRFTHIEIPQGTTVPSETIAAIAREKKNLEAKEADLAARITTISDQHVDRIRDIIESLEIESMRAEITSRFASSNSIFVIQGWLQQQDIKRFRKIMDKYGNNALYQELPFGHDEMPPTVLDNPKSASPFEFITRSYSLPNYFEIDPTFTYLIALPIIYGMIVGDVIYGFISIIVSLFLMNKFRKSEVMSNVSRIWFYCAFTTIIFGIIFDEWMGLTHVTFSNEIIGSWFGLTLIEAPLYSGFHRLHSVFELLGITALVGVVHVAFGFILGAINQWGHNKKHAIAKIAWLGVEVGGLLVLLPQMGFLEAEFATAGLAVLAVSIILLALGEGIVGIIELPGLIGNILSYTRIMAVGIVGVVIAEMINELLKPNPETGLVTALILLPIFIILHTANAFIAMFEALIQGGRLNIVEFKSKFLLGGGETFDPFMLKKNN